MVMPSSLVDGTARALSVAGEFVDADFAVLVSITDGLMACCGMGADRAAGLAAGRAGFAWTVFSLDTGALATFAFEGDLAGFGEAGLTAFCGVFAGAGAAFFTAGAAVFLTAAAFEASGLPTAFFAAFAAVFTGFTAAFAFTAGDGFSRTAAFDGLALACAFCFEFAISVLTL